MPPSAPYRTSQIAAVAGLALVVSACGSGGNSPADSAKASQGPAPTGLALDPCSLLTSDQVAQAIGKQVDEGKAQSEDLSESRACNWEMQATDYGHTGNGAAPGGETPAVARDRRNRRPPPCLTPRASPQVPA